MLLFFFSAGRGHPCTGVCAWACDVDGGLFRQSAYLQVECMIWRGSNQSNSSFLWQLEGIGFLCHIIETIVDVRWDRSLLPSRP